MQGAPKVLAGTLLVKLGNQQTRNILDYPALFVQPKPNPFQGLCACAIIRYGECACRAFYTFVQALIYTVLYIHRQ